MDKQRLAQHVTILGWLFIAINGLSLLAGLFTFVLLVSIGFAAFDPETASIVALAATALAVFLTVLGLPGIIAGVGLLRRKSWGRILAIIIGAFNFLNFPLGTFLGVYTLWVLLQPNAGPYFATGTA